MEWIEERTKGRVKLELYHIGELSAPFETYDSLISGKADITWYSLLFNPDSYPAFDVLNLPDMSTICTRPSRVAMGLYDEVPEIKAYFADSKILSVGAMSSSPYGSDMLGTGDRPVSKIDDLKGLRINGAGKWLSKKIDALGAEPKALPPHEILNHMNQGLIDGSIMDGIWLDRGRLQEVIHYATKVSFSFTPWILAMNRNTWDGLPADIQKVFEDLTGTYYADHNDSFVKEETQKTVEGAIKDYGLQIVELSPDEIARWNKVCEPIRDEYAAEMSAKGIDGKKLIELADSLYEKYAD